MRVALCGVGVRYGPTRALVDLSLEVGPGEVVGLIGPSGAGKTTLLRACIGAARPAVGRVVVDGRDLASLAPAELRALRSRVGFIAQDHGLVPTLRVSQNVLLGRLGRAGWFGGLAAVLRPGPAALEEVHRLLERVGIGDKLFHRVDALSGGEQQRVAIARALYQEPAVLLADEPVASVDPARARELVGLLRELAAERGATALISLHHLELARTLPRLVGLRAGRLCFDRRPAEVSEAELAALYRTAPGAP